MGGTQEHLQSYLTEDHECMWQIICHFCSLDKTETEKKDQYEKKDDITRQERSARTFTNK